MLTLQVAFGIVLGFILLAFLPSLIRLAAWLIGIGIVFALVAWAYNDPSSPALVLIFFLLAVVCAGLIEGLREKRQRRARSLVRS